MPMIEAPVTIEHPVGSRVPQFLPDQEPLARQPVLALFEGTEVQAPAKATVVHAVVAGDYREVVELAIQFIVDGKVVGHRRLDLGKAMHGLHVRIALPSPGASMRVVQVEGGQAVWVLAPHSSFPRSGLLACSGTCGQDRLEMFTENLRLGAITQFGWNLGCVTEACSDMAALKHAGEWDDALLNYLSPFLVEGNHLRYQNSRGAVETDTLSVEAGLPCAGLARHPLLAANYRELGRRLAEHWLDHVAGHREHLTAEGTYCTAYPMLQTARWIEEDAPDIGRRLQEAARQALTWRREALSLPNGIALRNHRGKLSFVNWARAWAWYLLGEVRSARLDRGHCHEAKLKEQLRQALGFQREDGLWGGFVDDSGSAPDTSGSAGIAAAMLWAAKLDLLPVETARRSALTCWHGLSPWIDEAGWVHGNCPGNRRGEGFQRGPTRDANAFAVGLVGQLHAGLLGAGITKSELAAAWSREPKVRSQPLGE